MIESFMEEIRSGKRQSPITSAEYRESMSREETWRQIRRELEEVGITPELFNKHRQSIVALLRQAVLSEAPADSGKKKVGDREIQHGRPSNTYSGLVKWFNAEKGFGFVQREDGKDVFVNSSAIDSPGYRSLNHGESVEFEVEPGPRGFSCARVRRKEVQTPRAGPGLALQRK
jgi:CspA family cold shock protein